jgi:branched-chain amino acid transport system permease protein
MSVEGVLGHIRNSARKMPAGRLVGPLVLVVLALLPVYAALSGDGYVLTFATRMLIWAIAAVSLNLIVGYGGMPSFGHAAFFGIGGYAVGVMSFYGIDNGYLQWSVAVVVSAIVALVIGALSLRSRGFYFIMITLAFAQLLYYMAQSAYAYGGDDGMTVARHSRFGDWINLGNRTHMYYLCFGLLLIALFATERIVRSRFGRVLRGAASNDRRMQAIGFPTFRYRLTAFVISGTVAGLCGALLVNDILFVSPSMMSWLRSGDLFAMVIIGGSGSMFGPLFGTIAILGLEELLTPWTEYWRLIFAPILIALVLGSPLGINGLLNRRGDADDRH